MARFDEIKNTTAVIGIFLSPLTIIYWLYVLHFDPYQFLGGVLYELLWLPMLMILHGWPILSLICWVNDRFSLFSWHLFAMIPLLGLLIYVHFIY